MGIPFTFSNFYLLLVNFCVSCYKLINVNRIKTIAIISSLVMLFNPSMAQTSAIDSLNRSLQRNKSDLERYQTLSELAIAYSDSNYVKSLEFWQKALRVAENSGERHLVANALHQIGFTYMKMGEFKLSLENLENAGEIYQHLDSIKLYAGVQNDIGLIYRNWGKYDKALEYYLNALDLYRKINDIEGVGIATNSIGQIYYYRENYPKAIEFFKEYLDINEAQGNKRSVAGASNNIASAYMELGRYDDALEYYLKALHIYDSLGISIGVAIIQDNIGSLYYKQNLLDNALLYHQNALDIFESLKSVSRVCYTQKNLGQVLLAQGKVERAIEMFEASRKKAKEIGLKDVESECNKLLSDCYVKLNNYPKAYGHLLEHIAIKDSILNSESIQKIEELQAQYEKEKKEQELNSINAKLKIQRLIFILSTSFIATLTLVLILVILENRKRKNALEKLEQLKNHIFQNISKNACNLELVKNDCELEGYFSACWEAKLYGEQNSSFFHFTYKNYTFCYMVIATQPNACCDFVNFNIYNIAVEYYKNHGELNEGLQMAINDYLIADPIIQSLGKNAIVLYSFILHKNKILSLCPENMAYRQFGSFIVSNTLQWTNLRPDDIVYMFGNANGNASLNELRKMVKSIDLMEFTEQKDVAMNFLNTLELHEDSFILAFKV